MADGDGGTPAGDDGGSDGGSGGGDGGAAPRDLATVDLLAPALAVVSRCNVAAHQCVRCLADGDCPIGKVCSGNQCVAGCTASHGCAAPATCCDGQCTVVADDTANCGACGNACNGGWSCCGGVCANPNNSVDDCGGCGHSCAARHGTPQCAARACVIGACDDGWQDCNGVVGDGCEVNVAANINNCGACSNACSIPHAQSKCAASTCVIDVCIFPYADCDGSLDNGCETNIGGNDPGNCGGCGAVCSGDHVGGTTCAAGQCTGACVAGYADCDGNKQRNGCEISTSSDPGNCGGCGNACSTVNIAQPACTGGQCTGDCDAGYADCDFNKASNGCERSVASDAQNCGGCNQVCSSNNILHPTCGGGACDGDCNDGTDDCDGSKLANGCESLIARQGSCSHPLTQTGSTLSGGCDPDGCVSQICKNGAFSGCCFFIGFFSSWDQGCVDQVASLCHRRAPCH